MAKNQTDEQGQAEGLPEQVGEDAPVVQADGQGEPEAEAFSTTKPSGNDFLDSLAAGGFTSWHGDELYLTLTDASEGFIRFPLSAFAGIKLAQVAKMNKEADPNKEAKKLLAALRKAAPHLSEEALLAIFRGQSNSL